MMFILYQFLRSVFNPSLLESLVLVAIILTIFEIEIGTGTQISYTGGTILDVDQLETQFDTRLPSSFRDPSRISLWQRQRGFSEIPRGPNLEPSRVSNWELYAEAYWYETRWNGMECPEKPYGFATFADWAHTIPCVYGDHKKPPRIIFVNTFMLPHFVESTLRFMNKSKEWYFVLVSGGADRTVPNNNLEARFHNHGLRGFQGGGSYFSEILKNPQVVRWYAENRDVVNEWKFSSIPTGSDWQGEDFADPLNASEFQPIHMRPLLVMTADRVREGTGQWQTRADVKAMCSNYTFCIQPFDGVYQREGIPQKDFNSHLAGVPFISCAHGGGVDPSPKAWDAIRIGTIPIIQKLTIMEAYEHLPVAFIDSWESFFHHPDPEAVMRTWLHVLAPYYEYGSLLRKKVVERLTAQYWVDVIHKDLENYTHVRGLNRAERDVYDDQMRVKSRDHVISVTLETANKMIAENPEKFSSSKIGEDEHSLPPAPPSPHQNGNERPRQNSTERFHQNNTERLHQNSTERFHQNGTERPHHERRLGRRLRQQFK